MTREIVTRAAAVLEQAWDPFRGYCFPNVDTYPHLWLWDSCFHTVAWSAVDPLRGRRELHAVFDAQLPHGFVPHMRYAGPTIERGPLDHASSFTQPPVFGHAARRLVDAGLPVGEPLHVHVAAGLDYLWSHRRRDGLLVIYHPWESGADDSPRWDSWVGEEEWNRPVWTGFDFEALAAVAYDDYGAATDSNRFVAAPAAFNAIAVHACREHAAVSGDERWAARADDLAAALDDSWDEDEALWSDRADVGGGPSVRVPTLDGVLGALATTRRDLAHQALDQVLDPDRFAAPYGPTYVARSHARYRPDQYWRGSAWPQMAYLVWLAARRWERDDVALAVAEWTSAGAVTSGFSEHWNPESGEPLGATPQTWAAVVAAFWA